MKRKYLNIIIAPIVIIGIGIIAFYFLNLNELIAKYEIHRMEEDSKKDFDEIVVFCEESQREIEAYSKRYISMKHQDMTYEELEKLEKQIMVDMKCTGLFEKISICYSGDWEKRRGIIIYDDGKIFGYENKYGNDFRIVEILYTDEEISEQENIESYFFKSPIVVYDLKKINAHLYVCIIGYEYV